MNNAVKFYGSLWQEAVETFYLTKACVQNGSEANSASSLHLVAFKNFFSRHISYSDPELSLPASVQVKNASVFTSTSVHVYKHRDL